MGFVQRKLQFTKPEIELHGSRMLGGVNCEQKPSQHDDGPPPSQSLPSSRPPPPPPSPPAKPLDLPRHVDLNQKHLITSSMTIMACTIGGVVLLAVFCAMLRVHYVRRNNTRRERNPPLFFGSQGDFLDEEQGPEIDHPIWYINTIGLDQSLINSIAVFQYKKEEGLIEGTECSVCLNEFEEDESLRLLPKCSHAFHITCIDTWLASHKNCPMCRAPILCQSFVAQATASEPPNLSVLGSRDETQMENSENSSGLLGNQVDEGNISEVTTRDDISDETNAGNSHSILRHSHSRVKSDLAVSRQNGEEEEMQPMRRSVSMDSMSALAIYNAVATAVPGKLKKSNSRVYVKQGSGTLCMSKLVKSSSIRRSLQKAPISMKRSCSSSGKSSFTSSRHSRSQDSYLPF